MISIELFNPALYDDNGDFLGIPPEEFFGTRRKPHIRHAVAAEPPVEKRKRLEDMSDNEALAAGYFTDTDDWGIKRKFTDGTTHGPRFGAVDLGGPPKAALDFAFTNQRANEVRAIANRMYNGRALINNVIERVVFSVDVASPDSYKPGYTKVAVSLRNSKAWEFEVLVSVILTAADGTTCDIFG